jgi:hypothetical protein
MALFLEHGVEIVLGRGQCWWSGGCGCEWLRFGWLVHFSRAACSEGCPHAILLGGQVVCLKIENTLWVVS